MKVLIADKLPGTATAALRAAGCDVRADASLDASSLRAAIERDGARVLVVRSTKVGADALRAPCLGLVVRAGAGVNTIDVATASAEGVYVANCPGKNNLAVAELAIGLLLALDRRIPDANADLRAGRFRKGEYGKARGLAGRTLGIVGAGSIGLAVAERARGLGMRVIVWNRSDRREFVEAIGARFEPDLLTLARLSDAVSLHVAAAPETKHLAGRAFFDALRPGALLVNTARETVIDEDALRDAIEQKGVRAGLDVFVGEPAESDARVDKPLLALPGVIATPHIGASTDQAQEAVADETVRIILAYKDGRAVPNVVNLASRSPATHALVVRHKNRVGVLAAVFDGIRNAGINVEETENIVFAGGDACIARISVDGVPAASAIDAIAAACPDILDIAVSPLGGAK